MDHNTQHRVSKSSITDRPSIHTSGRKPHPNHVSADCYVTIIYGSGSPASITSSNVKLDITKHELLQINQSPLWEELCSKLKAMLIGKAVYRSGQLEVHLFRSSITYEELQFIQMTLKQLSRKVAFISSSGDLEYTEDTHASTNSQSYNDLLIKKPRQPESISNEFFNKHNYEKIDIKDDSATSYSRFLSMPSTWDASALNSEAIDKGNNLDLGYSRSYSLPATSETSFSHPPEKGFLRQGVRERGTSGQTLNNLSHYTYTDSSDTKVFEECGGASEQTNLKTKVKLVPTEHHSGLYIAKAGQISGTEKSIQSDSYSGNYSIANLKRTEPEDSNNGSENKSTKTLITQHFSLKQENGKTFEIKVNDDRYRLIANTKIQDIIKQSLDCTDILLSGSNIMKLQFSTTDKTLEEITGRFENMFSEITVKDLSCRSQLEDLLKELHVEGKIALRVEQNTITVVGLKESIFHLLFEYTKKHSESVFSYFSFEDVNGLYEILIKEIMRTNVVSYKLDSSVTVVGTFDDVNEWKSAYEKIKESAKYYSSEVEHGNKPQTEVYINPRYVILFSKKPDVLNKVKESLPSDYRRVKFLDDGRIFLSENNTHERLFRVQDTVNDLLDYRELTLKSENDKMELKNAIKAEKYIMVDVGEKLALVGIRKLVEKFLKKMNIPIQRQLEIIHTSDSFKLCSNADVLESEIEDKFSQVDGSIKIYPMVTGTETVQFCEVDIKEQSSVTFMLSPPIEFERKTTETEKDGNVLVFVGNDECILNFQQFLYEERNGVKLNDLLKEGRINKIGVLFDERYGSKLMSFIVQFLLDYPIPYHIDVFVPMTADILQLRVIVDNLFSSYKKQYGGKGHFIELDRGYSEKELDIQKRNEPKSVTVEMNENDVDPTFGRLVKYKNNKSLIEVEQKVKIYLEEAGAKKLTNVVVPVLGVGRLGYPAQLVAKCMLRQIDDFFKFNTNTTLCHVKIPLKNEDESTQEAFFLENISRIKRGIMLGDVVHKAGILISSQYRYQQEIEGCLRDMLNEPLQQYQLPSQNSRSKQKKQNSISPVSESSRKKMQNGEDGQDRNMHIENRGVEFFQAVRWKLGKNTIRKLALSSDALKNELKAYLGVDRIDTENGDFIIEMSQEQKDKAESFMTSISNGNGGARPKEMKNTPSRHESITVDCNIFKALKRYVGKDFFNDHCEVSAESDEHCFITVKDGAKVKIKGTGTSLRDVIDSFFHEQTDLPEDKISDVYAYIDEHKNEEQAYCFVNDDTQTLHVIGLDKKEISRVSNGIKRNVLMRGKSEKSIKTEIYPTSLSTSFSRFQVHVKKADITKLDVDIVVNAANELLAHGGGVAAAISEAGGRKLKDDCQNYIRNHGKIPVTNHCRTSAGKMKSKLVYHAVGPQWYFYTDKRKCLEDLCITILRCLVEADKESPACKSIAFPSISAAIFAVPQEDCSTAYVKAVHYFNSLYDVANLKDIYFVDINDTMVNLIAQRLQECQSYGFEPERREQEIMRKFIKLESSSRKGQAEYNTSEEKGIVNSEYNVQVIENDEGKNIEFKLESGINIYFYEGDVTSTDTESFTVIEDLKMNNFTTSIRSIIEKAGPEYSDERSKIKKENQSCLTPGSVFTLQAGKLKFRYIFHLIMSLQPIPEEIQVVVENLFKEAKKNNTKSVTIGLGKLDVSILLRTILFEIARTTSCLQEIHLVGDCIKTIEKVRKCYKKVIAESGGKIIQKHPTGQLMTEVEKCSICLSEISDKVLLSCNHEFCKPCIKAALKTQNKCPICRQVVEGGRQTGNQPVNGIMTTRTYFYDVAGFPHCGSIQIQYYFPPGRQTNEHPTPGRRYEGIWRRAFLPNNKEGKEILKLLKIAFDRRLTFTIGRSVTTGMDGVITWNDIHHKTNMSGGPENYGYPDPGYLQRVREELKARGISAETEV